MTGVVKKQGAAIVTMHLDMFKELAGLRRTMPIDILHAELDKMSLDSVESMTAAKLWVALVAGSPSCVSVLKCTSTLSNLGCSWSVC